MKDGGHSHLRYTREISPSSSYMNDDNNCDKINFSTDLQNIQSNISDYCVNDILDVKLDVVERIYVEGEHGICGYITAIPSTQLKNCLKKGKQFEAVMLNVSSTSCRVKISPI